MIQYIIHHYKLQHQRSEVNRFKETPAVRELYGWWWKLGYTLASHNPLAVRLMLMLELTPELSIGYFYMV